MLRPTPARKSRVTLNGKVIWEQNADSGIKDSIIQLDLSKYITKARPGDDRVWAVLHEERQAEPAAGGRSI